MKKLTIFLLIACVCSTLSAQTISCLPSVTVTLDANACVSTVMSDLSATSTDAFSRIAQTAGIQPDHSAWSWGWDEFGQLGAGGDFEDQFSPVRAGVDQDWRMVTGGSNHSLGIKEDGTLWGWGINQVGQMGDPSYPGRNGSPRQIGCDSDWHIVQAGGQHSLGIRTDGTLWAWGEDNVGQLGDGGTNTNQLIPVQIGTWTDWEVISASEDHSFGIRANGTLWGWGSDMFGALGDGGADMNQDSPVQIGTDTDWVAVSTGGAHALGLKADGTLWAWGRDANGSLGDGGLNIDQSSPVQIGTDSTWHIIATGGGHSMGIKTDGSLWAWGLDNQGQLGMGPGQANKSIPTRVGLESDWDTIVGGPFFSLGMRDGSLWSWGGDLDGQLGDGGGNVQQDSPVRVGCDRDWKFIATGKNFSSHSLGIRTSGALWGWGDDGSGQVGNSDENESENSPLPVEGDIDWMKIAAGGNHNLGIKADGTLWAWGHNTSGQLGDGGSNDEENAPVQIGSSTSWVEIACGSAHSLALQSDGTIWAWGSDSNGQLGDGGSNENRVIPIQIGTDTDWIAIGAGSFRSFGIRSNGTLWAWGRDVFGALGDGGSEMDQSSPVQVGSVTNWVAIDGGLEHSLGLQTDGTLWAWGSGGRGQLGDGSPMNAFSKQLSPIQIGSATDWREISAGRYHSTAIKADGSLWAWGFDANGELGDGGTNTNQNSPVQVGTDLDWKEVSAGEAQTMGIKENGTLWSWGTDAIGQLGNGAKEGDQTSPMQIGVETNWVDIETGGGHSLGLQNEGYKFPFGTNTLTYQATDPSGNMTTCSTNITVPYSIPSFICPTSTIRQNTNGGTCSYLVSCQDLDPGIPDHCQLALVVNDVSGTHTLAGTTLPKGRTTVTWTLVDVMGNSNACTYDIRIRDREAPVISNCPSDQHITVPFPSSGEYVTWPNPVATDNCNSPSRLTYASFPLNGSFFPLGSTVVSVTITDRAGNSAVCDFTVTVDEEGDPTPPGGTAQIIGTGVTAQTNWNPQTGTLTILSSGGSLGNQSDNLAVVSFPSNDAIIDFRARVNPPGAGYYEQAGIMMRQALTSNSKHTSMALTGTALPIMSTRTTTGGFTLATAGATVSKPYWLRLYRIGGIISGYVSADGISWTFIQNYPNVLTNPLYLCLFSITSGATGTATFDHITINGSPLKTGIVETQFIASLRCHPNPFRDRLEYRLEGEGIGTQYRVSLLDLTGRVVITAVETLDSNVSTAVINTSKIAAGIYFLEVHAGDTHKRVKVVKR